MKQKLIDKFWQNVQKGNPDECWIWIGTPSGNGYGQIRFEGIVYRSNVLSYLINNGEIPNNLIVRHSCDNPICVNPKHLLLGTHQDNVLDMHNRGRAAPTDGENNGNNRFSKVEILQMRLLYSLGKSCKEIAGMFDTNPEYIRNVVKRKVWKSI